MSIIATLRRILNDTPGTATNIDYNFQVLEDYINTEVVTTDGLNSMTGPLVVGPPVADTHAATKSYVDGLWFTGMVIEFAGDTLSPAEAEEWALCNGSLQSTTDPKFALLFQRIQYRYGGSGGSFNLPDFRGRVSVGRSDIGADAIFATVGNKGGVRDNELLSHTHTVPIHGHGMTGGIGTDGGVDHLHGAYTLGASGGGAHGHTSNGGHSEVLFRDGAYNTGYAIPRIDGACYGAGGVAVTWGPLAFGGHGHAVDSGTVGPADRSLNHSHSNTFAVSNATAFNVTNAGAGTTLTDKNMPPWLCVNRIIKL